MTFRMFIVFIHHFCFEMVKIGNNTRIILQNESVEIQFSTKSGDYYQLKEKNKTFVLV